MDQRWFPQAKSGGQVVGRFRFYEQKLCVPESLEQDQPVYRKIVILEAKPVASVDVSTTPVKPHNERQLRNDYPEAWAAFQGEDPKIEGTPTTEAPFLDEDRIMFLKLNGVYVLEQLAMLSDARCQGLGFGWRTIRGKAQAFLVEKSERIARQDKIRREITHESA